MKRHKFSHTDAEYFDDGSGTVHHVHESGDSRRDVKHAFADLDDLHDSIQKHLNPEDVEAEAEKQGKDPEALEEKVHPGIHDEVAKLLDKE